MNAGRKKMVEFQKVVKQFGPLTVLDGVDLEIAGGEVVVVVGPSGSGKSTLLRCINVLEKIQGGDLLVDGISVRGKMSDVLQIRLEAGMVFQQFNLFPQMTALENVMFGPVRARKSAKEPARALAMELLTKVGLTEKQVITRRNCQVGNSSASPSPVPWR